MLDPFLKFIINGQTDIDNLSLIYILYLSNTVASYFFAYKRSIFSADQRERVLHAYKLAFYIVRSIFQIIVLLTFHNFILYLTVQILCTIAENMSVSVHANKCYSFLVTYREEKLTKEERKPIFDNIKALFIYKIGGIVLDGTDNIIISVFNGVISVGLLSNYTLVTGSLQMLLSQLTTSITGSVGNFIAKEDSKRYEELFGVVTFLHFIVYGVSFVGLMAVINPFIQLWAGEDYVLSFSVVFIHCLNFYIYGMMNSTWTFRTTMGLFIYGKWRPLISAVINIIVSIWWAKYLGLFGVLLGTTFTRIVTNVWYDPFIVFKHGLKKKPLRFYITWALYLLVCLADIFLVRAVTNVIAITGIQGIIINGVIAVMVFIISVMLIFGRSSYLKYLLNMIKRYWKNIFMPQNRN